MAYGEEDWKRLLEEGVSSAAKVDAERAAAEEHARRGRDERPQRGHGYNPGYDSGSKSPVSYKSKDRRDGSGDEKGSANGSSSSRHHRGYPRHGDRSGSNDYGRYSRSRSPRRSRDDRYHRHRDDRDRDRDHDRRPDPRDRDRYRDRDHDRYRDHEPRRRSPDARGDHGARGGRRNGTSGPPDHNKDDATVFVQQLSRSCRERQLSRFFEQCGEVRSASVVMDRDGKHSKGIGFVEFVSEESVQKAIDLTGQKLLGVPIIVQKSEAEKNRVAPTAKGQPTLSNGIPFKRLYIGNVHFDCTEAEIAGLFEVFGTVEVVQLNVDENGRSRGHGTVLFENADDAKVALNQMNGVVVLGRPMRVGLGNKELQAESNAALTQRLDQTAQNSGSAFSGAGGRGNHAGGGRDDKNTIGMGALDDSDVGGVNYNNYSRESLMKKLARTEDPLAAQTAGAKAGPKKAPVASFPPARCILIKNAYDEAEEQGNWEIELSDDFKTECSNSYGKVVHCAIPDNERDEGQVYVKFEELKGGDNALKGLNGRLFGGRHLTAAPVIDAIYNSMFPAAAQL